MADGQLGASATRCHRDSPGGLQGTTCQSLTDHVQFPDVRIEFETVATDVATCDDIEVMTPHYRGAHASAKVAAGFARYHATGARLGGGRSSTRGGRGRESRLAEEMLR